jgi:hypothetical protein
LNPARIGMYDDTPARKVPSSKQIFSGNAQSSGSAHAGGLSGSGTQYSGTSWHGGNVIFNGKSPQH